MLLIRLSAAICGSILIFAHSVPAYSPEISARELQTYQCARNVAGLVLPTEQPGPVFKDDDLVFSSLETRDGANVLIVSAGSGTFVVPLALTGVNRLRFQMPGPQSKLYYISFAHDSLLHSRFFNFATNQPPFGRQEAEYTRVEPRRAAYMLANLEYAILETSENALNALTEGRLDRRRLSRLPVTGCEHIAAIAPALAQRLRHNVEALEMLIVGPARIVRAGSRLPASVRPRGP